MMTYPVFYDVEIDKSLKQSNLLFEIYIFMYERISV
jgi:hypothetical protein